jgi:hypothetical protein
VLGSGPFINAAVDNGVERASRLLGMTLDEVKNRATIAGAVETGRLRDSSRSTCWSHRSGSSGSGSPSRVELYPPASGGQSGPSGRQPVDCEVLLYDAPYGRTFRRARNSLVGS